MTGIEDVRAAAERIAGHVLRTPVIEVSPGVYFKLETLQHSGSFKARGAFNRLLSGEVPASGVIAASGGNHGLAVAYAARALGVRAEIFVPEVASPVKVAGLRALGAEITQIGSIYAEAAEAAAKRAGETGAMMVHAYNQPEVLAGQGTVGLEIMEQTGGVDTIIVAVGGGGLIAGVTIGAGAAGAGGSGSTGGHGVDGHSGSGIGSASGGGAGGSGKVRIIAVEPELCPTLNAAFAAGRPVHVDVSGVASDALGASQLGELAFDILSPADVTSLLVTDEAIVDARHALWDEYRVPTEHAGAAAYAALLSGVYTPAPGERVAVIVCGSNTDPTTLTRLNMA